MLAEEGEEVAHVFLYAFNICTLQLATSSPKPR